MRIATAVNTLIGLLVSSAPPRRQFDVDNSDPFLAYATGAPVRRACVRTEDTVGRYGGLAQCWAGATAAEFVSAADDALRGAKLAGGGTVVTEGDVAAGAGRGVAKVAR
jgi:hypothetical protein